MHRRLGRVGVALAGAAAFALAIARPAAPDTFGIALFEQYVESFRRAAGIPGLSAALVRGKDIVWERGFGFQDVENNVRARPDTPYPIGGLTQTFAAELLLQCAERGQLDLDAPMAGFSTRIPNGGNVRVRHVLSHSSEGVPGERFKYDPVRFAALIEVSNACSGFGFRKVVFREVLDYLGMGDSVPGADVMNRAVVPEGTFDPSKEDRFKSTLERMAVPYRLNKKGDPVRSELTQTSIDTSTGIISTVRDVARYERELSDPTIVSSDTLSGAWSNVYSSNGTALPTGLGWFVQTVDGQKIVWSFGVVDEGYSSLMVRLPVRNLTLIMLANTDGLAAQLAAGDVMASPFVRVFLKTFP
jgi:CubicO group peptidase (beta-lactamase class C family)